MKNKDLRNRKESVKTQKIIIGCSLLMVSILVIAYLCVSQFYKDHFYARTFINGTDCSNLTVEEAKEKIATHVNTYVLTIKERNDVTEKISAADIGLTCTFDKDVSELLENQSAYAWIANFFKKNKVDNPYTLSYDNKKLKKTVDSLLAVSSKEIQAPVNATISEYDETKGFTIIEEQQGNKVDETKLLNTIQEAVMNLKSEIVLEELGCYEAPTVTKDSALIKDAMNTINQYMNTKLTYTFGEKTEVLDGKVVGPALKLDEDYNVVIDESKVKEFVDYIGKTYNTIFTTRTFMTSYGKEVTLDSGDYGWWLNRDAELKEIVECIKNGEQKDKEPVYYQKAVQYGDDDIGTSYVEINLSAQHLFVYKDGKKVLETDFVSGRVSNGNATPEGVYPIQHKRMNATLKGEGYATPVTYWMPFNRNIGMHDAYWRDSFGGDIFINSGSHGCINLPPAMAKKIYEIVENGMPVICYELAGTESYDLKKYENAAKRAAALKEDSTTTN